MISKLKITILLSIAIVSTSLMFAQSVYVTKVIDGDTFIAEKVHYRIAEIDAPELTQSFGQQSKSYLSNLILNRVVQVIPVTKDKYNRQIVKVWIRNKYVADQMVNSGLAIWYSRYSNNLKLKQLQEKAKSNKKGMWLSRVKPVNPYLYRIQKHKQKPKQNRYVTNSRNKKKR